VIIALFALFLPPNAKIPYLDRNADSYFNGAIYKAGATYAVCRGINAGVSVIKESQVNASFGVGITLAVGQLLDPLDDLTERASDILITSIISLGIQKILYELSVQIFMRLLAIAVLFWVMVSFCHKEWSKTAQRIAFKTIFLIIAVRLCLPISAIISSGLDSCYFSPQIDETQNALKVFSPPDEDILVNSKSIKEKTAKLWDTLKSIDIPDMVANLLKLSYLYVAGLIIQVVVLPLGVFWVFLRIMNRTKKPKRD
jgi:hypothetical protein